MTAWDMVFNTVIGQGVLLLAVGGLGFIAYTRPDNYRRFASWIFVVMTAGLFILASTTLVLMGNSLYAAQSVLERNWAVTVPVPNREDIAEHIFAGVVHWERFTTWLVTAVGVAAALAIMWSFRWFHSDHVAND